MKYAFDKYANADEAGNDETISVSEIRKILGIGEHVKDEAFLAIIDEYDKDGNG